MNITKYNPIDEHIVNEEEVISSLTKKYFIEANTIPATLEHLQNDCIIPVFSKDNESTISHFEFIAATQDTIKNILTTEVVFQTEIRVSHQVKGRIPSAIGKPAKELEDYEKTIYYERCAFVIELPEIHREINGNILHLSIGGVRAYNQENLNSRKSLEKFKVFVGFQNSVCTNLCISTDGLLHDVRVSSKQELEEQIILLMSKYNQEEHVKNLTEFHQYSISEDQFAYLIGKMKMYQVLPKEQKKGLFHLAITDSQVSSIVKDFYHDPNFKKRNDQINIWNLYNLFTEANKSSYIDNHLERNVNAYEFIKHLLNCIQNKRSTWFLNILYY